MHLIYLPCPSSRCITETSISVITQLNTTRQHVCSVGRQTLFSDRNGRVLQRRMYPVHTLQLEARRYSNAIFL